jgi:hypothetical protein
MGLTVVGLLAAHHGLRVDLRPNLPSGTIAEVTIPTALLRAPVPDVSSVDAPEALDPADTGRRAINGVRRQGTPPETDTAELPIFASLRALHGLPVRSPRPHDFPERQCGPGRLARRDPCEVAATLSAYARGIRAGRAQHRPPWTHDEGK